MPCDFEKKLKLKQGDIKTREKGDLTAIVWKDKRNINMFTNMHCSPAEGNLFHKNKEMSTEFKCSKGYAGFYVDPCFRDYHTKLHSFEDCLAVCWEKWNAKHKYCNFIIILLIIF
jgi:hypothetical protein